MVTETAARRPGAAALRTGLPAVRVTDPDMARWITTVSEVLREFDRSIDAADRKAEAGLVLGGGGAVTPGGEGVPNLATPPKPVGLQAIAGIGLIALSWDNPFRFYSNHAQARIFRATVDAFDQAIEIGQARYVLYIDDQVAEGTTYYYWVRFESTTQVLGPVSDSISGSAALDPDEVYREVVSWLEGSPLLAALTSDIETPSFITEEIRRLSGLSALLGATIGNHNASRIQTNSTDIVALRAGASGGGTDVFVPGEAPNRFSGDARADAVASRDAYGGDAGNMAWLQDYDDNPDRYILLEYHSA